MGKPSKVSRVVVSGPLSPFVAAFASRLEETGYTALSAVNQLRVLAHVSRWLEDRGLEAADLTDRRVEDFLLDRRAAGCRWALSRRALTPLLAVLTDAGMVAPAMPPAVDSPTDVVLAAFERYLVRERGLASSTVGAYVGRARRFMAERAPEGRLEHLTAADVTAAVLGECTRVSAGSAQYFVAALRSFLRFCHVEGLVSAELSAAALAVTGRRVSALPRGISSADVAALLGACDRRTRVGRRDYAVIVTLRRLGLRASEVAALSLDDLDWRVGELVVHGKGARDDRLPLPQDVGEAIAGYLRRGRPKTSRREVFLSAIAPVRPLGRGAVSGIVRRACVRAGLPPVGAHRLRHTAACDMVQAGASLPEIGETLRHRDLTSTSTYARVNLEQLRTLAQPWPGGPQR